ncbi:hypothetical protein TcCL_NonESM10780 [Trypanosoma cruzi]|nr:hypothetical protein TcCL_NonESM10780 [Trypanosoma cruzi]
MKSAKYAANIPRGESQFHPLSLKRPPQLHTVPAAAATPETRTHAQCGRQLNRVASTSRRQTGRGGRLDSRRSRSCNVTFLDAVLVFRGRCDHSFLPQFSQERARRCRQRPHSYGHSSSPLSSSTRWRAHSSSQMHSDPFLCSDSWQR